MLGGDGKQHSHSTRPCKQVYFQIIKKNTNQKVEITWTICNQTHITCYIPHRQFETNSKFKVCVANNMNTFLHMDKAAIKTKEKQDVADSKRDVADS